MAHLMPPLRQVFYDSNGERLALGKVYFYAAGTTTPLATYQDKGELSANANPVILDANGEADIWLQDLAYKVTVRTAADVLVKTVDNVRHINLESITPAMIDWDPAGDGLSFSSDVLSVNVDSSTIEIASDSLRVKDLGITSGKLADLSVTNAKLAAVPYSKLSATQKLFLNTLGRVQPKYSFTSPVAITDPPSLPAGPPQDCVWSPDGKYLAVAHTTTPYLTVYERQKNHLSKLDSPSSLPAGNATASAWSPCGKFLSVAHATTPFVTIYKFDGLTLTKLTNPGSLPLGEAYACAWSADSRFLAVGFDQVGGVGAKTTYVYERSGTSFSLAFDTTGNVSGDVLSLAFSPNGSFLAIGGVNGLSVYTISGSSFTELHSPGNPTFSVPSLPGGSLRGLAFSKDSSFLACAHSSSPFVTIYSISGSTFTKITNPSTLPASAAYAVDFLANENLAVAHVNSPYLTIYSISGSTFTKLTDPAALPDGDANGISFTPDGRYLAVSHSTGYLQVYKTSSSATTDAVTYLPEVLDV